MDFKRCCLFAVFICLVVSPPTRGLDLEDRRWSQALRMMRQLRGYLQLGPDASLDDIATYAVAKFNELKKRKYQHGVRKLQHLK